MRILKQWEKGLIHSHPADYSRNWDEYLDILPPECLTLVTPHSLWYYSDSPQVTISRVSWKTNSLGFVFSERIHEISLRNTSYFFFLYKVALKLLLVTFRCTPPHQNKKQILLCPNLYNLGVTMLWWTWWVLSWGLAFSTKSLTCLPSSPFKTQAFFPRKELIGSPLHRMTENDLVSPGIAIWSQTSNPCLLIPSEKRPMKI